MRTDDQQMNGQLSQRQRHNGRKDRSAAKIRADDRREKAATGIASPINAEAIQLSVK